MVLLGSKTHVSCGFTYGQVCQNRTEKPGSEHLSWTHAGPGHLKQRTDAGTWPFFSRTSRQQIRERRRGYLGLSVKSLILEVLGPSPPRRQTAMSKEEGHPMWKGSPTETSMGAGPPVVSLINSQVGSHDSLSPLWSPGLP